jgi:2-hydroxychromene-2-carboxylate isomerase
MSSAAVHDIWDRIHALSEEDRLAFEREWACWVEEQWRSSSQEARKVAAQEGLDDAAIARAVDEVRYGK